MAEEEGKPMLLRELLGETLREERVHQGRTLREVSGMARVSLGYLSEVERGQKEASSELLAAICTSLDLPLSSLLSTVSDKLVISERPIRPVAEVRAAA
ncbi:helix-turn-helix domain-containing protein [Enemella evansiae]|nr:helix-turn-helix protein [Enemella evansiae]